MPPSTTNKRTITNDEWERSLSQIQVDKNDLNALVMNYLIVEGYKDAAEIFAKESSALDDMNSSDHANNGANHGGENQNVSESSTTTTTTAAAASSTTTMTHQHQLDTITDRVHIRNLILQQGKIEEAIDRVNDLNPEILENNPQLFFKLQQQQLIELIRSGDLDGALAFAMEELAPRGEENAQFLNEIEKTMSLLAFENWRDCPMGHLMNQSQRIRTASDLNSAILESQCQERCPKLPNLLKFLIWAQRKLDERVVFPKMINVQTGELSQVGESSSSSSDPTAPSRLVL